MRRNLKVEELGDLLELPILAILATHRKDGRILMSPVWHEWDKEGFLITTWANDVKSKNIKNDPRVTVLVTEQVPPYRSIEVSAEAIVEPLPDHMPIMRRLASRYIGPDEGPEYAETFRDDQIELVRVTPGVIRAWDFNDSH
ncbi:MAG: TIGR03618 family F420-dependent PPOX class oxidoreductase [Gammaproteobacteria bacterium]